MLHLLRHPSITSLRAALLAGAGAMLCISSLALLQHWQHSLLIMAPFGATMVILFALPDSPLTLGLATGLGVSLMVLTNTLHPPAGANPLLVMLTVPEWDFLLTPVLSGAVLIVLFGVIYHRMINRRAYPLRWF